MTLGAGPWPSSHPGGGGGGRLTMVRAAQACGQSVLSETLTEQKSLNSKWLGLPNVV